MRGRFLTLKNNFIKSLTNRQIMRRTWNRQLNNCKNPLKISKRTDSTRSSWGSSWRKSTCKIPKIMRKKFSLDLSLSRNLIICIQPTEIWRLSTKEVVKTLLRHYRRKSCSKSNFRTSTQRTPRSKPSVPNNIAKSQTRRRRLKDWFVTCRSKVISFSNWSQEMPRSWMSSIFLSISCKINRSR